MCDHQREDIGVDNDPNQRFLGKPPEQKPPDSATVKGPYRPTPVVFEPVPPQE